MSRIEEYIEIFKNVVLRAEDEEEWFRRLDELYYSMSEEEMDAVEREVERLRPEAPESLGLVDVPVEVGESRMPRLAVKNPKG
jgi:hypothetical protein